MDDDYSFEPFTVVAGRHYRFVKVLRNGRSPYDKFENGLTQKPEKSALASIFNIMGRLAPGVMLPQKLFRHIEPNEDGDRTDIYEFKKNNLRVYVAIVEPSVVILLGGYKKDQDKDVERVFRQFNQMPNPDDEQK